MTAAQAMTTIDQVLSLARRGWKLFPVFEPAGDGCACGKADCSRVAKHPRVEHGLKEATDDPAQLQRWWARWPSANVGLATGGRSGLFVIDVDGPAGDLSLKALELRHGPLPATLTATSGRTDGGRHLYFRAPAGHVTNKVDALGVGVDVRGDGGYVILPPSTHASGRSYVWVGAHEPAEPPPWLTKLVVRQAPPAPAPRPKLQVVGDGPSAYSRARAYLARLPESISGSGGHDALFEASAATVRGFGLTEAEALELLISDFNPRCQPPWSQRELEHKVRDVAANCTREWGYLLNAPRPERTPATKLPKSPPAKAKPSADKKPPTPPLSYAEGDWHEGLAKSKQGAPLSTTHNVVFVLSSCPEWRGPNGDSVLAWNDFSGEPMLMSPPPWAGLSYGYGAHDDNAWPRPFGEQDITRLVAWLEETARLSVSEQVAYRAMRLVAERRRHHPVKEFLAGVAWDNVPRIDSWLSTYFGVKSDRYAQLVGRWFLLQAIARVMDPGCKADHTLILEGEQGRGKSTGLEVLFGSWYLDTDLTIGSKDGYLLLRRRWGIEFSELESVIKATPAMLKAFLSRKTDSYREPYARGVVDVPRQCVFAGSVNFEEYLRDDSGGRRFWPVETGTIDLAGLRRDRDAIWAEAFAAYQDNPRWWPTKQEQDELLSPQQERRRESDPWEADIKRWLEKPFGRTSSEAAGGWREFEIPWEAIAEHGVTVDLLLRRAIGLTEAKDRTKSAQMRVTHTMKALRWARRECTGMDLETGVTTVRKAWYPPVSPPSPPAESEVAK